MWALQYIRDNLSKWHSFFWELHAKCKVVPKIWHAFCHNLSWTSSHKCNIIFWTCLLKIFSFSLSLSTICWNHFHRLYLIYAETTSTVSIYYLLKPLPPSPSTICWNHFHRLYLLSAETTSTVSIYYLLKPLPLSLSTICWNHFHRLHLLSAETTSTVSIYYLLKPLPLSLYTICWNHFHCLYTVLPRL